MQLLKQIWNERRSNGWLWSELLIVFVVLWYVVDWTYVTARTYYEPVGFDITDGRSPVKRRIKSCNSLLTKASSMFSSDFQFSFAGAKSDEKAEGERCSTRKRS